MAAIMLTDFYTLAKFGKRLVALHGARRWGNLVVGANRRRSFPVNIISQFFSASVIILANGFGNWMPFKTMLPLKLRRTPRAIIEKRRIAPCD